MDIRPPLAQVEATAAVRASSPTARGRDPATREARIGQQNCGNKHPTPPGGGLAGGTGGGSTAGMVVPSTRAELASGVAPRGVRVGSPQVKRALLDGNWPNTLRQDPPESESRGCSRRR